MSIQNENIKYCNSMVALQIENVKAAAKVIELTIKKNLPVRDASNKGAIDPATIRELFSHLPIFRFYTEIRILNALIKCIVKGLNVLVVMFGLADRINDIKSVRAEHLPWLFRINVSNIIPDVTLDPMPKDIVDSMKFLVTQVYEVGKYIPRFKDDVQ